MDGLGILLARVSWICRPSVGRSPKGGTGRGIERSSFFLWRFGETGLSEDRPPAGLSAVPATLQLKVERLIKFSSPGIRYFYFTWLSNLAYGIYFFPLCSRLFLSIPQMEFLFLQPCSSHWILASGAIIPSCQQLQLSPFFPSISHTHTQIYQFYFWATLSYWF